MDKYFAEKSQIAQIYQLTGEALRDKMYYGGVDSAQKLIINLCENVFSNVSVGTTQLCQELYVDVWLRLHGAFINEDPVLANWFKITSKYITDKSADKYKEIPYSVVENVVNESFKIICGYEPEFSKVFHQEVLNMLNAQINKESSADENISKDVEAIISDLYNSTNEEYRDRFYYGDETSAKGIITQICLASFGDCSRDNLSLSLSIYVQVWLRTHGSIAGDSTKQPGYIKEMLSRRYNIQADILNKAVDESYKIILQHEPDLVKYYIAGKDNFLEKNTTKSTSTPQADIFARQINKSSIQEDTTMNYSEILANSWKNYFEKDNSNYTFDGEAGMFRASYALNEGCAISGLNFFIRMNKEGFTISALIPGIKAKSANIVNTAVLISYINSAATYGGFEMNMDDGTVYYKLASILPDDTALDYVCCDKCIIAILLTVKRFADALIPIMLGYSNDPKQEFEKCLNE